MSSAQAQNRSILAAGGALAAAGLAYVSYNMLLKKPKTSSREIKEIDEDDIDLSECITADEVVKVFGSLYMEMNQIFAALAQQIRQIQMTGQQIPEAQVRVIFKSEMGRVMVLKQQQILDSFDMDVACLEEATWEFLEDENEYPQVKKAVERFQELWQTATGESVKGWRPGKDMDAGKPELLSPVKLLEVAEKYFDALGEAMAELIADYKRDGKNLQSQKVQQDLNLEFMNKANTVGAEALEKDGVTQSQFEESVQAHASNPQVGQALGMLQMRNQQMLMQLSQQG